MADEDDFTFCQVGPPVEAQKVADDINGIHIDDGNSKAADKRVDDDIRDIHIDDGNANAADRTSIRNGNSWFDLSFNVVDASSRKDVDQRPKQEVAGSSNNGSPQLKTPVRKSAPRTKVPFEKGYSQMDWLKLTRTHPDLAGLKGQSNRRLISLNEVKQHQSEGSMWTVLKGRVYNLSPYMKFHPGGISSMEYRLKEPKQGETNSLCSYKLKLNCCW
ncbi:hypothetical protein DH2020_025716 [Rehmannia glutinosa]|uniref:Cytochrome b5 heme-binding domain-containing protein n=1 Tax=Rehmannia glutinosa TaxID=99300 RepID=A0ABR0W3A9_REHGL